MGKYLRSLSARAYDEKAVRPAGMSNANLKSLHSDDTSNAIIVCNLHVE